MDGYDKDFSFLDKIAKGQTKTKKQTLSQDDLEDALRKAGWDESLIPKMSAIGMAESSGKVNAFNPGVGHGGKPTKEKSYGIWQINMIHPERQRKYDVNRLQSDPVYNAKVALDVYKQGHKTGEPLNHWGAYFDGRYKKYYRGKPGKSFGFLDDIVQKNAPDLVGQNETPEYSSPNVMTRDVPVEYPTLEDYKQAGVTLPKDFNLPQVPQPTVPGTQTIKSPVQEQPPLIENQQEFQQWMANQAQPKPAPAITSQVVAPPVADQKEIAKNFQDYLAAMGNPPVTQGLIDDFNNIQKMTIAEANRQNAANAAQYNKQVEEYNRSLPKSGTVAVAADPNAPVIKDSKGNEYTFAKDQQGLNKGEVRRERDGIVYIVSPNGEIREEAAVKEAQRIASYKDKTIRLQIEQGEDVRQRLNETTAQALRESGVSPQDIEIVLANNPINFEEGGRITDTDLIELSKGGGTVTHRIPAKIFADAEKIKTKREAVEARIKNGESQDDALLNEGIISAEEYQARQSRRKEAEERELAAAKRFEDENKISDEEAYNRFILSQGYVSPEEAKQANLADIEAQKEKILAKYKSFDKYYQEQQRIEKEYGTVFDSTRPMAKPAEFVKSLASTIPDAFASVAKTIDIVGETMPLSLQNIYSVIVNGKQFEAKDGGLYQFGDIISKRLEKAQNKDLQFTKSDYILTNIAPKAIGQVMVQIGLGALSGGMTLPVLLGSSMGAAEQYDEALKKGAQPFERKLAAIVGGVAAVSDAIPLARFLSPLSKAEKAGFFSKILGSIFAKASQEVGEKAAVEVTKGAFANLLKKGGTLATGAFLEGTQELSEKKINDFVASLTYDPSRKVFVLSEEDMMEFLGGAIGGLGGAGFQIALESQTEQDDADVEEFTNNLFGIKPEKAQTELKPLTPEEVEAKIAEVDKVLEQAKAEKQQAVPVSTKPVVGSTIQTEIKAKGGTVTKQGVVTDIKGNQLVVEFDDGTKSFVRKNKATVVDENAITEPEQELPETVQPKIEELPEETQNWLDSVATGQRQTDFDFDLPETKEPSQPKGVEVGEPIVQNTLAQAKKKDVTPKTEPVLEGKTKDIVAKEFNEANVFGNRQARNDWYEKNQDVIRFGNANATDMAMGKHGVTFDFQQMNNGSLRGIKQPDGSYAVVPQFDSAVSPRNQKEGGYQEFFDIEELSNPTEWTLTKPAKITVDKNGKITLVEKGQINDGLNNYSERKVNNIPIEQKDEAPQPESKVSKIEETAPKGLVRNYRAGTNDGTIIFASKIQRDLFDYYANEKKKMTGGGQKANQTKVKDLSDLRVSLAKQIGVSENEIFGLASQVAEDVKSQMKGVGHLEERKVLDNIIDISPITKPIEQTSESTLPKELEKPPLEKSSADERRKAGRFTKDGVEYVRQPKTTIQTKGDEGTVRFSPTHDVPFHYGLIEADSLQPADLEGNPNLHHFLPLVQPNVATDVRKKASDDIAKNPRFGDLGVNTNAFFGAPTVNSRGEVIQGNNRSEGIKKSYGLNDLYRKQLLENAEKFGFKKEQVEKLKKPVMVRVIEVTDEEAILLGNKKVTDMETGVGLRLDPRATANQIPYRDQTKILRNAFEFIKPDWTLNKAIRENEQNILNGLKNHLSEQHYNSLLNNDGQLSPRGIEDIQGLFREFLFTNGHPDLTTVFENLPFNAREALLNAIPVIYSVSQQSVLVPEIQMAMQAANSYLEISEEKEIPFQLWATQADIFTGQAPADIYTPVELFFAQKFAEAETQKEIRQLFKDYAEAIKGTEATLFAEAQMPLDKSEAIEKVFKVKYVEAPRYDEEFKFEKSVDEDGERLGETEEGLDDEAQAKTADRQETESAEDTEPESGLTKDSGTDIQEMFAIIGEQGVQNLTDSQKRLKNLAVAKAMDEAGISDSRIFLATGWEKNVKGDWQTELNDSKAELTPLAKKMSVYETAGTLDEMLEFPELFKAYPELKKVAVTLSPTLQQKGVTMGGTPIQIKVRSSLSPSSKLSVILHEVQHIIQFAEGFPVGGSANLFLDKGKAESFDMSSPEFKEAFEKYQRIAGEAEARNVEFRRELSDEEREQYPFSATEDTPRARQIVITEGELLAMARNETRSSDSLWEIPEQEFTSADTSINSSKLPTTFNFVDWQSGTKNADIGGGRFDNATEFLGKQGVTNVVFDPFNRSKEHNEKAVEQIRGGQSDTATVNNVLNVIQEPGNRRLVIMQAHNALKEGGTAYFKIYEGARDNQPKQTSKGWQENRLAKDYMSEVALVFGDEVTVKGDIVIAKKTVRNEMASEESPDAEKQRMKQFRQIQTVPLPQVIEKAQIIRVGDRLQLNLAGMELVRRALEQVDIQRGLGKLREKQPYPAFTGLTPTDLQKVPEGVRVLESLARRAETANPELAKQIQAFADTIKEGIKKGERGSVIFYVLDEQLPHEILHQQSMLSQFGKDLDDRHTEAGKTKLDNSPIYTKAVNTFFDKQPEYSLESFKAKKIKNPEQARAAVIREEIAAYSAAGDWAKLGLTQEQAAEYLINFFTSFGQKVYDDNIKLRKSPTEANTARQEAFNRFGEIDYAKQAIETIFTKPPASTSESSQTDAGDITGVEGGTDGKDDGVSRQTKSGDEPIIKKRKTVQTVEQRGLIEEEELGAKGYYEVKSVEGNKREAQDRIDQLGLTDAINQAIVPIGVNDPVSLRKHGTFQMEVAQLLALKAEDALASGDKALAEIYNKRKKQVIEAISEQGTDAGQFIRQLAEWGLFDPATAVEYIEKKRSQNGIGTPLTLEEIAEIKAQAKEVAETSKKMAEVKQKLADENAKDVSTGQKIINNLKELKNLFFKNKERKPDLFAIVPNPNQQALPETEQTADVSDKLANAKNAFVAKYIEVAEETVPNSEDEVVIGALALATNNATATTLGKTIKDLFPERFGIKSTDTRDQQHAKVEDLQKVTAKAAKLNKLVAANLRVEAKRRRGITLEMEKELAVVKRARAKAMDKLQQTAATLERKPSLLHIIAQVRRMGMTSLFQTVFTNLGSTTLENYGMNKVIDTMDLTLQRVFKGLQDEGLNRDASIKDVWKTPTFTETTIDEFGNEVSKGMPKHEVMLRLIDEHPEYFQSFYGRFSSDFSPGVIKWLDVTPGMKAMRWQEFLMRDIEGVNALAHIARQKGIDITEGVDFSQFTQEDVEFVLKRVLELTYALRPDKRSGSYNDYVFATVLETIHRSGAIDLAASELAPFVGFMYNTINKTKTKIPVIAQARLLIKTGARAKALKLAGEDHFIKQAIKENWTSRQIANQIWGWGVLALAVGMVASLGDRDDWNYLRIPMTEGMAEKTPNNPTGSYYFDVRTQPMLAPFVFIANKINRLRNGKDLFTDKDYDEQAAELLEAFTGFSYRAAFEGDLLKALTYGGKWAWSRGNNYDREDERFVQAINRWMGNVLGTNTNFIQAKTIKDLFAQFDTYEQTPLNLDDRPFLEGIDKRLPESRRILEAVFKDKVKARKNYATEAPTIRNKVPILKIFGFNVTDGNFLTKEPSAAEITARKLAFKSGYRRPELADEKMKAAVKRDFEKESDRLRELGDKEGLKALEKKFNTFVQEGVITKGQEDYGIKAMSTTDLQENFKPLSAQVEIKQPVSSAEQVWRQATEKEKEELLPMYKTKLENVLKSKTSDEFSKANAREILQKILPPGTNISPGTGRRRQTRQRSER